MEQLTLESNFRSQQSLVDWNNRCFQKILPEEDNPDSGAIAFSKSTAIHAKESYPGVVLHPLDPKLNSSQASRSEAKEISRVIKQIRGESAEASIAILVRSRIHLKEIIRELELLKISYKAESIYTLGRSSCNQRSIIFIACTYLSLRQSCLAILITCPLDGGFVNRYSFFMRKPT